MTAAPLARRLFGRPALAPRKTPLAPEAQIPPEAASPPPRPDVSAVATGAFSLFRGARVVEVEVTIGPVVVSALVLGDRVAMPTLRGAAAVRCLSPLTQSAAHRAAVEAARAADTLRWVA